LNWTAPFNYAAVNNFAAEQAAGEVFLFLNNDIEAINRDWLERLLEHAVRPEVGAVGAKLYYPDDTVQHAGIVLGICGVVGHAFRHCPRSSEGYGKRLVTARNVSAVTGACLMVRRDVFREVQGFDERLEIEFNDLDLCLKLRQRGYWNIWTPHAELYHWESKTRGSYADNPTKVARFRRELELFIENWADVLAAGDPFYNPNLTREREDFSLPV
jgi:GT2 family glycosyltransferase